MRKPPPITPTVYAHLFKDEWTGDILALWVKSCPYWWCKEVAKRLTELHTVRGIKLIRQKDLQYRYGYIQDWYEMELHNIAPSITEEMLRWSIEHEFNQFQNAQVEWTSAHRILNLKRKKI